MRSKICARERGLGLWATQRGSKQGVTWQQWEVTGQAENQTRASTQAVTMEPQASLMALSPSAKAGTWPAGPSPDGKVLVQGRAPPLPLCLLLVELLCFEKDLFFRSPRFLRRRGDGRAVEQQC